MARDRKNTNDINDVEITIRDGDHETIVYGHRETARDILEFMWKSWGMGEDQIPGGEPVKKPKEVKADQEFKEEAVAAKLTKPPAGFSECSQNLAEQIKEKLDTFDWLSKTTIVAVFAILY